MENRIKEQLMLFADRTSTAFMRSNQIRLYFSSIAYLLMEALRRLGLKGTELAQAQATTIRLKVLKIGALIRVTVRKVWIALAGGYPYAGSVGEDLGAASAASRAGLKRGIDRAWYRKDIHRRECAESRREVLGFQQAEGRETVTMVTSGYPQALFRPYRHHSEAAVEALRTLEADPQKTGEKCGLRAILFT